jgi:hypothetical protein
MQITEQLEHALPFSAIFAELQSIRPDEFSNCLGPSLLRKHEWESLKRRLGDAEAEQAAYELLHIALRAQERAYENLQAAKDKLEQQQVNGARISATDLEGLEWACWEADQPLKRVLYCLRGNALAFSGGGIRSASFGLGVLEGLARFSCTSCAPASSDQSSNEQGLLFDTQYLCTISGGGYLGSWLSAWIYRLAKSTAPPGADGFQDQCGAAYEKVISLLAGQGMQTAGDPAPEPIRHLRQFTSYLAPRLGLTLDVWALAAIVLRNLLVNWMMLGPLLLAMLVLPLFAAYLLQQSAPWGVALNPLLFYPMLGALMVIAAIASGFSLPSYTPEKASLFKLNRQLPFWKVAAFFAAPILLTCWFLSLRFYPGEAGPFSPLRASAFCGVAAAAFGILALLRWFTFIARRKQNLPVAFQGWPGTWLAAFLLLFITVFCSLATGIGVEFVGAKLLPKLPVFNPQTATGTPIVYPAYIVFAFPAFVTVLLLGSTLFSALVDKLEIEEDREWWARAGGLLISSSFLWICGTALAVFSSTVHTAWFVKWLPVNGLALGGMTSWFAKSSQTSAGTRPDKDSQGPVTGFLQKRHLLLPALSLLSLILIAVILARGAERLRAGLHLVTSPTFNCAFLLVALLAIAGVINWIININIFSLHGLYRMRLSRAFLGASNQERTPDPFTHFDMHDSPHMTDLAHTAGVPLHIVGTTLNLVGTKRAEWRQRKAESFTFSAVNAGSWRLNYINSEAYGGSRGVTLATAMAISGAAANPNMGYHSSPLVTLLMTLFNVRLGWWLPNPSIPSKKDWGDFRTRSYLRQSGPRSGVLPLIQELFGKTDDDGKWIELSDGGHFENLGLYEMVLRRCSRIIVVDAGADPEFHFEDLGNALRKIEIDLGIPIRFTEPPQMQPVGSPDFKDNRYCAVANIEYSCVDSGCISDQDYENPTTKEQPMDGKLIYIKACLTGREPMDVLEYASSHTDFPHEPTTNQFFNEAQFESYRHLGSSIVSTIATNADRTGWEGWICAAEAHAISRPSPSS